MLNIIEFLEKFLTKEAIANFKETVFGYIPDRDVVSMQHQVVHAICQREVECREAKTLQFGIEDRALRFG